MKKFATLIKVLSLALLIFLIPNISYGATEVYSWGGNNSYQLGDGTNVNKNTPTLISTFTGITDVAAGGSHSLALKSDGTVWAWGANGSGQLGDGTNSWRTTPVQVTELTGITAIAAGSNHSFALKSDNTLWAWGDNGYGRLGDGTTVDKNTPVQVTGLTGVTAIAAGYEHSLALKSDGTVWAWGRNGMGQLGDNTIITSYTPVQVSGLTGITAIGSGRDHSLAVKNNDTAWGWGYNDWGVLGDGTSGTDRLTPVQVTGLTGVTAIDGGWYHSVALKSNGTVWAWGNNSYEGQLGDGTGTNRLTPVQTSNLTGIITISSGYRHTLALKSDNTVWAWGNGADGALGDGTWIDNYAPVEITSFTGITAIGAGVMHSLTVVDTPDTTPPTTTASPTSGTYEGVPLMVTLTCDDGGGSGCGTTRYTINGSEPHAGSPMYEGELTLLYDTTLKFFSNDNSFNDETPKTEVYVVDPTAPTTTASPATGSYVDSVDVVLTCDDGIGRGCFDTRYTTDGSEPNAGSTQYSGTIYITTTTTLKFFSNDLNNNDEVVKSEVYTITTDSTPPTTTASPVGGSYEGSVGVTLTCDDGAGSGCFDTRYTTDGSEPNAGSPQYFSSITISTTTTLKFFSNDNSLNDETANTEVYTITAPSNSVVINNDDTEVNQRAVKLTLTCGGDCVDMRISNDNSTWTAWKPFSANVDYWTVEWGNGTKTVTVEIRDSVSAVTPHSDAITLKDTSFGGIGGMLLMN